MTFSMKRHLSLAIVACAFASCANYSEVSGKRPLFLPKPVGRGILVNAEAEIEKALRSLSLKSTATSRPAPSTSMLYIAATAN